jgi:predicted ATPase/DNA-binding CsgD family transcriptional regulator
MRKGEQQAAGVAMNSAVVSEGIRARRQHGRLPADVSAFIGRADELTALAALLASAQLVTVTGPGGVGKTRLALRAAANASAGYPDGVALVELSGLRDERQLAAAIADGLGLPDGDPDGAQDGLLGYLRRKRMLLVLDTCEHVAAACARFAARIRREAAGVTVLATSRQPLRLPGERVLRLGPLPLPGPDGERSPGDAIELFAVRAAAALPGFALTAADLPDVTRLCRRLDGIPLALELAAVRVRALSLAELTRRLDARFSLLTGARRGVVGRHQTLRAAIEWSYDLATADERAVWERLSVFAGSFDLAAARAVAACAQLPGARVSAALTALQDKSVLLPAEAGGRVRLLESVREYAAERLARSGQEADCRRRQLRWYREAARDFGRHLAADDQLTRLARLRAEHAGLGAALARELGSEGGSDRGPEGGSDRGPEGGSEDLARDAARLAGALVPYWLMSGTLREGMRWQEKALERFAEPGPERAGALAAAAVLGAVLGRPKAVAHAREAVALAARTADERAQARGYLALQLALGASGRCAQALETAARARRLLIALGADTALLCLDVQLAQALQLGREFAAAADLCQRTLAALPPGERWLRGGAHRILALALYPQPGRQAECARAAAEALRAHQDLGDPTGAAYALEVFGWLAADAGCGERTAWLLGAAQALWDRAGGRLGGNAVLEGCHRRSARIAGDALGAGRYAELHARGAALPLGQITALATGDAGTRPGVPSPRTARDDGPGADGLTGRERQIAGLVARGLSNREIAARLVISQRTVDAHLNHIFGKIGVSSRVQLTRWLSDREPPSH